MSGPAPLDATAISGSVEAGASLVAAAVAGVKALRGLPVLVVGLVTPGAGDRWLQSPRAVRDYFDRRVQRLSRNYCQPDDGFDGNCLCHSKLVFGHVFLKHRKKNKIGKPKTKFEKC